MGSLLRIAFLLFVGSISSLSFLRNVSAADAPEKLTEIRMGLAWRSTTSMPFFVAKERGLFREEGLDVELIVMQAIQTTQATLGTAPNSRRPPDRR